MTFKKTVYQIHLWLGLVSGLIVFIVCITGAIWALSINGWIKTDTTVPIVIEKQEQPFLSPSQLAAYAKDSLQGYPPQYINYSENSPVHIGVYGKDYNKTIFLNPYNGKILSIKDYQQTKKDDDSFDFWRFIRTGHRSLWLPWDIGRPIVNYGTLAFAIVLISGLIIWFPKNKKAAKNRLWFNWKKRTPTKRKLFDLHSVLGFYICFALLAIAFTGIVWGIEWWSKGLYKVTSGGKDLPEWQAAQSDTLKMDNTIVLSDAVDYIFNKIAKENPYAYGININYPDLKDNASTINVTVYKEKDTYYNSDRYAFDRYNLQEIKVEGPYNGKYTDAGFGDKLRRMNYEIHIGSILGTPGRVLAFFAALFGATLPITGIYIYIKKRKKKAKK